MLLRIIYIGVSYGGMKAECLHDSFRCLSIASSISSQAQTWIDLMKLSDYMASFGNVSLGLPSQEA